MNPVIFDTGPLLAWLCPGDQHHRWALRAFTGIQPAGIVCEAVLTEVCHLAAKESVARGRVIEFVQDGDLQVVSLAGAFRLRSPSKRALPSAVGA
ncbi:MAG TPA: PIN domain-containing protein [Verrucomicrobiales bacterium]|nr:PIN domain-containing protein [Verrucomicrobiales bacterium]